MVKRTRCNANDPSRPRAPVGGNAPSSTPVIVYGHYEAAPLLPGRRKRTKVPSLRVVRGWCLVLVFALLVYQTCMHFVYCPPDTNTRDAARLGWEREKLQHDALQREWDHKHREQADEEAHWKSAKEQYEREVEQRIRQEHERQENVRKEWTEEIERHVREFEEMKTREREEWKEEQERWRWEIEERERHEEEERLKLRLYWGHVAAHTCNTYATREYTAELMNLPRTWNHRVEACKATPLEIHGIPYLPKTCEDRGLGVVIGRWEVNQQEPDCTTYWDSYNDKGCASPGSGKKHITHKLMNLPEKSDWKEFCATTPVHFDHMYFPGAQECFTSAWGVYGQWEIDDSSC